MRSVTTTIEACTVKIDWVPLMEGMTKEKVLGYKLELASRREASYHEYKGCFYEPTNPTCVIPMSTLLAAPYNLRVGDLIVARVSAETKKNGWGRTSDPNLSGAKAVSVPDMMSKPVLVSEEKDKVNLTWGKVSGISAYELLWRDSNKNDFKSLFISSDLKYSVKYLPVTNGSSREY